MNEPTWKDLIDSQEKVIASLRAENERLNHLTRNSQAIDNKLLSANSTIESLRKRCEDLEAVIKLKTIK